MRGIETKEWTCVRQRAGPLVKECRYRRPRLMKGDLPGVRREKNQIVGLIRDSSFRRTPVDRLELMLALMGRRASTYELTYAPEFLPDDFKGVRRDWRNFLRALKRWRGEAFDYVYCIEGRHGDHRHHIHLVLRDRDFSPAEVGYLWPGGGERTGAPLLAGPQDSFRRMARYLTKERTDGVTVPIGARTWVASRSLYAKLPEPERWRCGSGEIELPDGAVKTGENRLWNPFGEWRYLEYIEH